MPRFFIDGLLALDVPCEIGGQDAHKLVHVLRARIGDEVELLDSSGARFQARLEKLGKSVVALPRERIGAHTATILPFTLAQALPKGSKMDFIVEKASELGVARIIPFVSDRCIARECTPAKLERWRRLARASAAQCGRERILEISEPRSLRDLLAELGDFGVTLMPWELAEPHSPLPLLRDLLGQATSSLGIIGPEGGFSEEEAARAAGFGAHLIWLGPRILRTETAGFVLATAVLLASI